MKSPLATSVLIAISAVAAASGLSLQADTTTPATPGTAQDTDSKNQENNPAGPAAQNGGTPVASPDSKTGTTMDANHPTSVTTPAPSTASKPVQKKHKKKMTDTNAPSASN
jgi:hypothetical protein